MLVLSRKEGETLIIIGANGAGKTTLLRAVSGMIDFYDGDIIEGDIKMGETSISLARIRELAEEANRT